MFSKSRRQQSDDFHAEALPHMDALFSAAIYMTKDPRDAEDLVQETFIKAFRFFHRYQRGTNCKAWLFRIMTNTHINRNRGKKREFSYIENVDSDAGINDPLAEKSAWYKNPEQGYLHQLLHDEVKEALSSLPEDFRSIVILADLQEFSYKEIADIVDCPIGTVMSRLHRGRKMLQKRLRSYAVSSGVLAADSTAKDKKEGDSLASLDEYRNRRTSNGGSSDA